MMSLWQASRYVGSSVKRKEDIRLLKGRGRFVDDVSAPGMLHAALLRAGYAHAVIKSIDTSRAERIPGVVRVYTGQDLRESLPPIHPVWRVPGCGLRLVGWPAVAYEKVRFTGDIVAVAVAEDPYTARDALDAVEVEYDPLPVVVDAEEAVKEGAPLLHDDAPRNIALHWKMSRGGDPDEVFSRAEVVIRQRLVNQRLIPAALEPRSALAVYEDGFLTLWATTQNPHHHRLVIAEMLGLPEQRVRVIAPDVGGGFGSKIPIYPNEVIVSRLAIELGRPVKWTETRRENFVGTSHGRDHVEYVEVAAKRSGEVLGLRVKTYANLGAYLLGHAPGIPTILFGNMLSGPYRIGSISAEVIGAFTNTTPVEAYRGAGRPEATYILERSLDLLAAELGKDPADIRRQNFLESGSASVATGLTYDGGDYAGVFEKALSSFGYAELRKEQAEARKSGRLIGIGIANYIELTGSGPVRRTRAGGFIFGLWESAVVRVHPSGRVTVFTGTSPHGQGGETTLAQIAADALGVSIDEVDVVVGDTLSTPYGNGTYASRGTAVGGGAVLMAARRVLEKARRIAAALLEAREEDIRYEDGRFYVAGAPGRSLTFQDVAYASHTAEQLPEGMEPGLEEKVFYNPENFTFPYGTHLCLVEIDKETGVVKVLRYLAVDDAGRLVNPMLAEGQVHGGFAQGAGQALCEEAVYDASGNLLTSDYSLYGLLTSLEMPEIAWRYVETPSTHSPLGSKGIGETATVASPSAIMNAVCDALSPLGIRHLDMPASPERILRAISGARG